MTIYRCTERYDDGSDCEFFMLANMEQASSGIWYSYNFECEDVADLHWHGTPYQTADACHDEDRAAQIASDYAANCGGDHYAESVSVIEEVSL